MLVHPLRRWPKIESTSAGLLYDEYFFHLSTLRGQFVYFGRTWYNALRKNSWDYNKHSQKHEPLPFPGNNVASSMYLTKVNVVTDMISNDWKCKNLAFLDSEAQGWII